MLLRIVVHPASRLDELPSDRWKAARLKPAGELTSTPAPRRNGRRQPRLIHAFCDGPGRRKPRALRAKSRGAVPRTGTIRENFAWLNRFTLSLLKQHPGRTSIVMKRRSCGWSEDFLLEVLAGATV